jgi:hypothetical protein
MKNYVGRKCKGFRFEDKTDDTPWGELMEKFIGKVGLIVYQYDNYVIISFENDWLNYPISLIEPHLIPETPKIPQLGEGVEMEVSHTGIKWQIKKVIAQTKNGLYLSEHFASYKYARPIQEVKKYTKEELVKILGHDFEIV